MVSLFAIGPGGSLTATGGRVRTLASAFAGVAAYLYLVDSLSFVKQIGARPAVVGLVLALVAVSIAAAAVALKVVDPLVGRRALLILILCNFGLTSSIQLLANSGPVDVIAFQRIAAQALIDGENPYSTTYPDIYPPDVSKQVYGEGISLNGVLTRGFPYPPTSLLPVVPAHLLGDARIAHQIAITISVLLLLAFAGATVGSRVAVISILMAPGILGMPAGGWTEVFLGAALAGAVLMYWRGNRFSQYSLGLLLSLKQYTVMFLPLVPLIASRGSPAVFGKRDALRVAVGVLPWLALTIAFAAWDLKAFVQSVVLWQFEQPFRPDSLSLAVSAVRAFGWPPLDWFSWLPVVSGGTAGLVAYRRIDRTPAGFARGVAFVTTWFLLFSKQAFANYYFLVIAAMAVALAAESNRSQAEPAHD